MGEGDGIADFQINLQKNRFSEFFLVSLVAASEFIEDILQVLTAQQLHGEEWFALTSEAEIVDRDDVRVLQGSGDTRFIDEVIDRFFIARVFHEGFGDLAISKFIVSFDNEFHTALIDRQLLVVTLFCGAQIHDELRSFQFLVFFLQGGIEMLQKTVIHRIVIIIFTHQGTHKISDVLIFTLVRISAGVQ